MATTTFVGAIIQPDSPVDFTVAAFEFQSLQVFAPFLSKFVYMLVSP